MNHKLQGTCTPGTSSPPFRICMCGGVGGQRVNHTRTCFVSGVGKLLRTQNRAAKGSALLRRRSTLPIQVYFFNFYLSMHVYPRHNLFFYYSLKFFASFFYLVNFETTTYTLMATKQNLENFETTTYTLMATKQNLENSD